MGAVDEEDRHFRGRAWTLFALRPNYFVSLVQCPLEPLTKGEALKGEGGHPETSRVA